MSNAYELEGRLRKADALYDVLKAAGANYETVKAMDAKQWRLAAKAATLKAREKNPNAPTFHPPSPETIAEVTRIFRLVDAADSGEDVFAGCAEVWE